MRCDGIKSYAGVVWATYSCHVCIGELPKGTLVSVERERWLNDNDSEDIEPVLVDAHVWATMSWDDKWDLMNPGAEGASRA